MTLPSGFMRQVLRVGDCWEWQGHCSASGVPLFWNEAKRRYENAVRLTYRRLRQLGHNQRLARTCANDRCVLVQHHVTLDELSATERVRLVMEGKVSVKVVDGHKHWLWTAGNGKNPQVSVDGTTYSAVPWAFRELFPTRYRKGQRLLRRPDVCQFSRCVNPLCFDYCVSFRHLYTVRKCGYRTSCYVARREPSKNGYVRHGYDYLHRVVYQAVTGERLAEGDELHHLCGNRACCRPDHLRRLTKDEHLVIHGRSARCGIAETRAD
jgi:hypothetical protein